MSLKATAAIALATVGIASTLGHAALPPKDLGTPAGQQKELHRQMSQLKQREIAERREAARRLGDAVAKDRNRPAELREAEKLVRALLSARFRK